jgi:hypothetical protein
MYCYATEHDALMPMSDLVTAAAQQLMILIRSTKQNVYAVLVPLLLNATVLQCAAMHALSISYCHVSYCAA